MIMIWDIFIHGDYKSNIVDFLRFWNTWYSISIFTTLRNNISYKYIAKFTMLLHFSKNRIKT